MAEQKRCGEVYPGRLLGKCVCVEPHDHDGMHYDGNGFAWRNPPVGYSWAKAEVRLNGVKLAGPFNVQLGDVVRTTKARVRYPKQTFRN